MVGRRHIRLRVIYILGRRLLALNHQLSKTIEWHPDLASTVWLDFCELDSFDDARVYRLPFVVFSIFLNVAACSFLHIAQFFVKLRTTNNPKQA